MRKIIPGFEIRKKRETADCRITAFRDVLCYYGIEIDSHTLFVLTGGIGFQFAKIKLPALNDFIVWFAGCSILSFEDQLVENMSIPCIKHTIMNDPAGWEILKSYVDRDIPLLTLFDGRYLPENGFSQDSRNPLLNFAYPSIAGLVGYDTDKNEAYLTLSSTDDSVGLYTTELDEFLKYRNGICFPTPPDNLCYELTINEHYREWLKVNYQELLRKCLINTSERMTGDGVLMAPANFDAIPIAGSQGIVGMRMFCKEIEAFYHETAALEREKKQPQDIIDKAFVIKFLAFRTFFAQGSYSCFREEFGKGLKNVAKVLDNQPLDALGDGFMEIGYEWRTLIRQLFNVRYHLNDKKEFIDQVVSKAASMADKEYELFSNIRKALL